MQGQPHVVDYMLDGKINLVINTAQGEAAIHDSRSLRQTALTASIPYYTTIPAAIAATAAIRTIRDHTLAVRSLQSYLKGH